MKSVIGGIIGAVVAGLLLFFAQDWWSQSQADAKQRIAFEKQSDVALSRDELNQIARKSSTYLTPTIQVFEAHNTGTADIADRSFSAPASEVLGFASISSPNGNPKNAAITYDGKILSIKYRLLPVGAKHTFWVARNALSLDPEFANDSTGVHVVTSLEKIQAQSSPFPWGWFGALGACFVALIIGMVISEATVTAQLAKHGIDYKAVVSSHPTSPPAP